MGVWKRRDFLARAAATAALGVASRLAEAGVPSGTPFRVRPFPLSAVRLGPGLFREAVERNRRYVMSLDPDRLLHMFRVTAGLPTTAQPLGGWEQPENELRGHFTGHYLSACALLHAALGDREAKARGEIPEGGYFFVEVFTTLSEVSESLLGPVAQRLEQGTHNSLVPGSNPGGPFRLLRSEIFAPRGGR